MIDIELLLAPISLESPCGVNLRSSENIRLYQELKENRIQARLVEKKNLDTEQQLYYTQSNEYWHLILEQAVTVLQKYSKDIEISCWLLEAMVRIYGFMGLLSALKFFNLLIATYWDDIQPDIKDDIEDRTTYIQGLSGYPNEGTLVAPLYMLSLVPEDASEKISTWDYLQAKNFEKSKNSQSQSSGEINKIRTIDDLKEIIDGKDSVFYQTLLKIIVAAKAELELFDNSLNSYCQKQAPSLKNLKEVLSQAHAAVSIMTKDILQSLTDNEIDENIEDVKPIKKDTSNKNLTDYQIAMHQLNDLTVLMQKTQPLSIITAHLTRLLRWSKMPIDSVITEMFTDRNLALHVAHNFGIIAPQSQTAEREDD